MIMFSLRLMLAAAGLMAAVTVQANARDLSATCGADFNATVQRMQAGALSGDQATECWCFFWERGGSKPIRMFNGKQAADVCARFIGTRS
jgi:hypothetical protein